MSQALKEIRSLKRKAAKADTAEVKSMLMTILSNLEKKAEE